MTNPIDPRILGQQRPDLQPVLDLLACDARTQQRPAPHQPERAMGLPPDFSLWRPA
jgi:hypothetical protein